MSTDDYDYVSRSSLKLKKNPPDDKKELKKIKKHKNKVKCQDSKDIMTKMLKSASNDDSNSNDSSKNIQQQQHSSSVTASIDDWMTEAQKKFLAQQEKRQLSRVMAKASKTHKQRVEEFNTHLENLSEHYDIPKVSWTK